MLRLAVESAAVTEEEMGTLLAYLPVDEQTCMCVCARMPACYFAHSQQLCYIQWLQWLTRTYTRPRTRMSAHNPKMFFLLLSRARYTQLEDRKRAFSS
jgi:hypothetical protein